MNLYKKLILLFLTITIIPLHSFDIVWGKISEDPETNTVTVNCEYNIEKFVIAESLQATFLPSNENASNIIFAQQPAEMYSPLYPKPILVLHGKGEISFVGVDLEEPIEKIKLSYTTYDTVTSQEGKRSSLFIKPLSTKSNIINIIDEDDVIEKNESLDNESEKAIENNNQSSEEIDSEKSEEINSNTSTSLWLNNKIKDSNNIFIIGLLIFVLGFIMSLTPCIYPMIPLTLALVRGDDMPSRGKIALRALFYTLGIATTFALLGLAASSGVLAFGTLMGKTWFIVLILLVIGYLTGSMLGFYEITFPQIQGFELKSHSLFSLFIYGMASGTITSPCVSPGLITLLTIVGNLGNMFHGFLYLFIFGLGMGFPLCMIAIAFNSFTILPKSGMWMVEIKRIIGVLMLFVLMGYAKLILPLSIVYILLAVLFIIMSYLIYTEAKSTTGPALFYKRILVAFFIALTFFSIHMIFEKSEKNKLNNLPIYTSLIQAQEDIIDTNKKILIDFGADWCSYCISFEKKCFKTEKFWNKISDEFVGVKIDCTNIETKEIKDILAKYEVNIFPTVILIDGNGSILGRFEGELLSGDQDRFIDVIREAARKEFNEESTRGGFYDVTE